MRNGKYHAILDMAQNLVRMNFHSPIMNTSWPAFKTPPAAVVLYIFVP